MKQYLTREEAAAYLRKSTRTLANWAWKRTGPPYKRIQGTVRYPADALEQWADAQAWAWEVEERR
jgi:hypothetical protein